MVGMDEVKARLEGLAYFLEQVVGDYDFTGDEQEIDAAAEENREPVLYECGGCGTGYAFYDDARAELEFTRKILERLG